jgi:hypothetical protein
MGVLDTINANAVWDYEIGKRWAGWKASSLVNEAGSAYSGVLDVTGGYSDSKGLKTNGYRQPALDAVGNPSRGLGDWTFMYPSIATTLTQRTL